MQTLKILSSTGKQFGGILAAHSIATTLKYWYHGSPPGEIVSLGVMSEGTDSYLVKPYLDHSLIYKLCTFQPCHNACMHPFIRLSIQKFSNIYCDCTRKTDKGLHLGFTLQKMYSRVKEGQISTSCLTMFSHCVQLRKRKPNAFTAGSRSSQSRLGGEKALQSVSKCLMVTLMAFVGEHCTPRAKTQRQDLNMQGDPGFRRTGSMGNIGRLLPVSKHCRDVI